MYDDQFLSLNQENQIIRTNPNSCERLREIHVDENRVLDWIPAEPFKQLDFIGLPTNVDMEGALYIQDREQSEYIVYVQPFLPGML